jgi:mono/diheme cytochrome c family protein
MKKFIQPMICGAFALAGCGDPPGNESDDASAVDIADDASAVDIQDVAGLTAAGRELYMDVAMCWVCHGTDSKGDVGPALDYGPTPFDISYMLRTNPEMAGVREVLQATNEDLLALSVYIRDLNGLNLSDETVAELASTFNSIRSFSEYDATDDFVLTARDSLVEEIEPFATVLADWERRAKPGNIMRTYQVEVAATFDPGEPKFDPQPGKTYFYENTGAAAPGGPGRPLVFAGRPTADSNQIVVGDAETKEIIAYYRLPMQLRSAMHTTALSPDGQYVFLTGARPYSRASDRGLDSPATLIKADALTLQPLRQLVIGGRMHHAQIFQDRYMLIDTFSRDLDGLDVFLLDPQTDEIIGGVRDEELGGASYTAFTDDEYIYILMQPGGYAPSSISGYLAASQYNRGRYTTLRPFWVAKVDPQSWEVVQEYPYPGFRANWIVIDSNSEFMYVPAGGSSYISKIDLETGAIVWTTPTGTGPYGASLNVDESEIWVADKGETTGMFGRTITVIATETGRQLETIFSGYQVDHVLLAPNGKEMWATSNSEGRIYVFDAASRDQLTQIDMPGFGDTHGLVWVHYDETGTPRVARDQGGFHNGINPVLGTGLDY